MIKLLNIKRNRAIELLIVIHALIRQLTYDHGCKDLTPTCKVNRLLFAGSEGKVLSKQRSQMCFFNARIKTIYAIFLSRIDE